MHASNSFHVFKTPLIENDGSRNIWTVIKILSNIMNISQHEMEVPN